MRWHQQNRISTLHAVSYPHKHPRTYPCTLYANTVNGLNVTQTKRWTAIFRRWILIILLFVHWIISVEYLFIVEKSHKVFTDHLWIVWMRWCTLRYCFRIQTNFVRPYANKQSANASGSSISEWLCCRYVVYGWKYGFICFRSHENIQSAHHTTIIHRL